MPLEYIYCSRAFIGPYPLPDAERLMILTPAVLAHRELNEDQLFHIADAVEG